MGIFVAIMDDISVAAAKDLMRITADTTGAMIIHEVKLSQKTLKASERFEVKLQKASTDGTGSANTPKDRRGAKTFGGTAVDNLTVDATAGDILDAENFDALAGYQFLPTPEAQIEIPAGTRFVVRLDTVPATANWTLIVVFEQNGV